jgi:hypothetical protein
MLHIDLHDNKTGRSVNAGTLEEFVDKFLKEIGSVTWVFSNAGHTKRAKESLIRVFQKAWDEKQP